mgnify:CR=1 FL=1
MGDGACVAHRRLTGMHRRRPSRLYLQVPPGTRTQPLNPQNAAVEAWVHHCTGETCPLPGLWKSPLHHLAAPSLTPCKLCGTYAPCRQPRSSTTEDDGHANSTSRHLPTAATCYSQLQPLAGAAPMAVHRSWQAGARCLHKVMSAIPRNRCGRCSSHEGAAGARVQQARQRRSLLNSCGRGPNTRGGHSDT